MKHWVIDFSDRDQAFVVASLAEMITEVADALRDENWFDGEELKIVISTEEHPEGWLDALPEFED